MARAVRLAGRSWGTAAALAFVILLCAAAVAPDLFAPYPPQRNFVGPLGAGPSPQHPFGTDGFGRDVLSRVVAGSRVSVVVALSSCALSLVLGSFLGAVAASAPRMVRGMMARLLDVTVAFPAIILAVALAAALGPSLTTTVVVLAVLYTPAIARVVRASVLAESIRDYVVAERSLGASETRILVAHIAPNVVGPVLVFSMALTANAILVEAALSFLGLSVQPPAPSWGNIVNDGRDLVTTGGWWVTTFGGLAVCATALCLTALAESFGKPRHDQMALPEQTPRAANGVADGGLVGGDTGGGQPDPSPHGAGDQGADWAALAAAIDLDRRSPRVDTDLLLEVKDLSISFPSVHGDVDIVSGVSMAIRRDEVAGLIGESGSGKTLVALAIMGLLPATAHVSGSIEFHGRDLLTMPKRQRRRLLGHQLAMIYQDALSSLNPGLRIGTQLHQVCRRGGRQSPKDLLQMVDLVPQDVLLAYPHQLSGGQRQRVLIAMALSRDPELLVADEPTTALDVTLQAQFIALLERIRTERGFSMLLVSHDLGLVAEVANTVNVMYAGSMMELGHIADVLHRPSHPYTAGLIASIVSLELGRERLAQIPGSIPPPSEFPAGCRFYGRCPRQSQHCKANAPSLEEVESHHGYRCHHPMPLLSRQGSAEHEMVGDVE